MRKARYDITIVTGQASAPWGVVLGHDFCSEHEWGIRKLLDRFGVPAKSRKLGVNCRTITQVPLGFQWAQRGDRAGILLPTAFDVAYEKKNCIPFLWKNYHLDEAAPGINSAWDDESFMVTSTSPADIETLRAIYKAFQKHDVAIATLSGGMGTNPLLAIASLIPPSVQKEWKDADRDARLLAHMFKSSRIEKILAKAGRRYFYLGPKRLRDGTVAYWLNPMEQDQYNAGYYSLEDLKAWAQGRGRIVKKQEAA